MADLTIISTLAKDKGIKMSELAESLGISPQALFQMIRNNSTKVSTLENIAEKLGVSPAIFFGVNGQEPSEEIAILKARIQSLEMINKAQDGQIEALKASNELLNQMLQHSH